MGEYICQVMLNQFLLEKNPVRSYIMPVSSRCGGWGIFTPMTLNCMASGKMKNKFISSFLQKRFISQFHRSGDRRKVRAEAIRNYSIILSPSDGSTATHKNTQGVFF